MGTDIHMYVETQKSDGTWQAHNPPAMPKDWQAEDKYRDHVGMYLKDEIEAGKVIDIKPWIPTKDEFGDDDIERLVQEWEIYRSYDLFAMLADQRNGRGFAGCKTGDGFNPISGCSGVRMLPDDLSPALKMQFEYGWLEHSPHWLLMSEVLNYDWDQETKKSGVVSPTEYARFKKEGRPIHYSGGISGGNVVHISNALMEVFIGSGSVAVLDKEDLFSKEADGKSYYTTVEWGVKYRDRASYFLDHVVPEMQKLHSDPSKIRLVMFFDS